MKSLPQLVEYRLEVVSKVFHEDHDAGDFKKAAVDRDQALVPDGQPAPVPQPSEEAFHFPAFAVASQFAPVLERRPFPAAAVRANQFASDPVHEFPQPVGVIGLVGDEPFGQASCLGMHIGKGRDDQLHLGGRCGGKGASHRKTLAVRHHHPLRSLSLLGLSDAEPPFLAGAKLPSMKHSCQSSSPSLSRVAMKPLQTASQIPSSSQSRSRRQQVTGEGRCLGMSRHLAPVLSTQSIPSRTSRSLRRGRPNVFTSGSACLMRSQTPSVMNS